MAVRDPERALPRSALRYRPIAADQAPAAPGVSRPRRTHPYTRVATAPAPPDDFEIEEHTPSSRQRFSAAAVITTKALQTARPPVAAREFRPSRDDPASDWSDSAHELGNQRTEYAEIRRSTHVPGRYGSWKWRQCSAPQSLRRHQLAWYCDYHRVSCWRSGPCSGAGLYHRVQSTR